MVAPACILLGRHAVELVLKDTIRFVERVVASDTSSPVMTELQRDQWMRQAAGHDLVRLRDELQRLLGEVGRSDLLTEDVRDVIDQVGAVDPAGDAFRYATKWDKSSQAMIATPRPAGTDGRLNVVAMGKWLSEATTAILLIQDVVSGGD